MKETMQKCMLTRIMADLDGGLINVCRTHARGWEKRMDHFADNSHRVSRCREKPEWNNNERPGTTKWTPFHCCNRFFTTIGSAPQHPFLTLQPHQKFGTSTGNIQDIWLVVRRPALRRKRTRCAANYKKCISGKDRPTTPVHIIPGSHHAQGCERSKRFHERHSTD